MRALLAFLRRDALEATAYKLGFLGQLATLASTFFTVTVLARMLGDVPPPALRAWGGPAADYFGFALIGVAAADMLAVTLHGMVNGIRWAQAVGTLEAMLATPAPAAVVLAGPLLYPLCWSLVRAVAYVALGTAFGARFTLDEPFVLGLVLGVSLCANAALGALGAATMLLAKSFEPRTALVAGLSALLGGVLYPREALPSWLITASEALPLTHALEALRTVLLRRGGLSEILPSLAVLSAFAVVLGAIAWWAVGRAIARVRRDGTMGWY